MSGDLVVQLPYRALFEEEGIASVADLLERATVVRDLPDRQNRRLDLAGCRIFLKGAKKGGGRERAGAARAAALGVPTPALVCHAEPGGGRPSWVGFLDLAPARPLDDLLREAKGEAPWLGRVATALARVVARLHDGGVHHRDLYLNHVFVDPSREEPIAGVIDWERLGRHRLRLGPRVVKDLAALDASAPDGGVSDAGVSEILRRRFLLTYLEARGLDRGAGVRGLGRRVRRKARRIRRHVPKTPVGDAGRPGAVA